MWRETTLPPGNGDVIKLLELTAKSLDQRQNDHKVIKLTLEWRNVEKLLCKTKTRLLQWQ